MTPQQVRALMDRGPFIASEAVAEKLVDELAAWPSFAEASRGGEGGALTEVSLRRYLKAGRPDRRGSEIAVVVAEGSILRGESGYSPVPLFGGDIMGSDTIARAFRQVRDSRAKAVVFRINSPGGSAVASELIREEMVRTAKQIPVVVSMGGVAGSGGYWIACGANRIVADPGTITASIGVFGGHFAMERFWTDKLGVSWGRLDTGPAASIYGSLEPWTPEQRVRVEKLLDRIYDAFVERVSVSRGLSREAVDAVGRGRVFTGVQARDKGLVDVLGGFDVALVEARALAKLAPGAPVSLEIYPRPRPLWQQLTGREEQSRTAELLRVLAEGRLETPGAVWMPPLLVR
jgi:protease-4